MLSLLHIENIAVIECADIVFDKGFNVMTGETGAGKSIVIDAICAILGERAYRDMIRTGAEKSSVRAVFTEVPALSWFEENGVPYDPETVLYREIFQDGRNICRVNGMPVSVSILRKLGIDLVNIHGQHDSAVLFDESSHLGILDDFAGHGALLSAYQEKYRALSDLREEIASLRMDESEKLRRMESLQFQIGEIENAALLPDEDTKLEERRKVLQNAEKLSDALYSAAQYLYGDESTEGAASLIEQAEHALSRIDRFTDAYSSLHSIVTELMYQARSAAEEIRDAKDSLSYSEDELERIESRLDTIHRLRRKYGASVSDILDYLTKAKDELAAMEDSDDRIRRLEVLCEKAEKEAHDAVALLRKSRVAAAEKLSEQILSELSQLDMPNVRFSCEFSEVPLSIEGGDAVAFYMSANAGESLKPLSKVASGGELARIMLALKNVLADKDHVQTLIFDEVDTGVSGRAAQKVARKLRSVASTKQVLCVTHLPQLAALATTHFRIEKQERGGRTYTEVVPLDTEGRKMELARMIGGERITETTLKSAEEMLEL